MNLQAILLRLLVCSLTSLGLTVFLVVVYAGFLMAERGRFAGKLQRPSRAAIRPS